MKANKDDGKDKYRKKSFTPPKTPPVWQELSEPTKWLLLHMLSIVKAEKQHPYYKLFKLIIDVLAKGANPNLIYELDISTALNDGLFSSPDAVLGMHDTQEHNKKVIEFGKQKRKISQAKTTLQSLLPIRNNSNISHINRVNGLLKHAQECLSIIDSYLFLLQFQTFPTCTLREETGEIKIEPTLESFLYPQGAKKLALKKYVSASLNKKIVELVDELLRIGYSQGTAHKKTAEMLRLAYPKYCARYDADIVKQRYRHRKKE